MTKETKKDASESFRDSFKGKNYWIKKLKPKYEHFLRACFLFIHLSYKKPGLIVQKGICYGTTTVSAQDRSRILSDMSRNSAKTLFAKDV